MQGSKFGLAPAAAAELIKRIEHSPRLRMRGLHVHVGSQILDVEPFADVGARRCAALGEFEVYDLGGGLGARYTYADQPPSVAEYLDALVGAARAHLPAEAQLIIEPGRSMVAGAAITLYRVVTVKRGAVTFVAVDGGMGDNLEVALFGQRFEAGAGRSHRCRGRGARHGRRPALRKRRRADRRRRSCRIRASVTCSPSRSPVRTASRCPTTTTAIAGYPSSSFGTDGPGWSSVARHGTTCWPGTWSRRVERPIQSTSRRPEL